MGRCHSNYRLSLPNLCFLHHQCLGATPGKRNGNNPNLIEAKFHLSCGEALNIEATELFAFFRIHIHFRHNISSSVTLRCYLYCTIENFQQTIVKIILFLLNQINASNMQSALAQDCIYPEVTSFVPAGSF